MFLRRSFYCVLFMLSASPAFCQSTDLEEKKPVLINGIEYGYTIRNEQTKAAKGEEYSRFEITLYATNKTGCTKLYANRVSIFASDAPNLLATYNCTNANGKRLTSKSGTVRARDFYVSAKVTENGKETTQSVKAGFIFRNGETLRDNIIVLVPLGERPVINCSVNTLPELQ